MVKRDEQLQIDGFVKTDHEGLLICGAHHARRYGWRSLPTASYVVNAEGETIEMNRPDFRFSGLHPAVIERYVVFGEEPATFATV